MTFVAFRDVVSRTFNRITAANAEEGAGGWYTVNTSREDIYEAHQAFPKPKHRLLTHKLVTLDTQYSQ